MAGLAIPFTPTTNQYGGSSGGVAGVTSGTPNAIIGTTATGSGTGGGGGGGGGWGGTVLGDNTTTSNNTATNNTQTAPTAQQIAAAAQNAKIQSLIDSGLTSAQATGNAGIANANSGYTSAADTAFNNAANGQDAINQARKNVGMTQINSIKQLMNTIQQGLRGTGVNLGNTNALDSSARDAAARIYGQYGNVQTNSINNQAAGQNSDQDVAQTALTRNTNSAMDNLKAFRDQSIATIQSTAQQQLASLKSLVAQMGGDPGKVDVDGITNQIIGNAQNKLALVDQHLATVMPQVHAQTADEVAQNAYQGVQAGVTPSGPGLAFQTMSGLGPANQATDLGGADTSLIPLAVRQKTTA